MIDKVGFNTPKIKKEEVTRQAGGYIAGTAIGLATTFAVERSIVKEGLKDEFKKAKENVKSTKSFLKETNATKETSKKAIKEAKEGIKKLKSQVSKDAFKNVKKLAPHIAVAVAALAITKDILTPAIMTAKNHLFGDKKAN